MLHRARTEAAPTLVILDEIHHGGDNLSWGDAMREAFEPATRRLGLTGTPFRSDTSPIPFVRYELGADSIRRSQADYTYGYAEALRDGVVRPVLFLAYGGSMRWRTKAGDEVSARLGEPMTGDATVQARRTALDVKGERPVVVLSDYAGSSGRIEEFAEGNQRWMVAVRMVSEGVDVPRLCVGVYATSTATPPTSPIGAPDRLGPIHTRVTTSPPHFAVHRGTEGARSRSTRDRRRRGCPGTKRCSAAVDRQ